MSARYGSRTRSGEAVSDLGRRGEAGGGAVLQPYEEIFTAPGTWTKPAGATSVDVFLVGGGGGGGVAGDPAIPVGIPQNVSGAGGGGGVRIAYGVPVSAPVPVTIGAGGAAGIYSPTTITSASIGGTSAFGPLGPGPVPAIPAPTIFVDGGGRGGNHAVPGTPNTPRFPPTPSVPTSAPENGGGGGGGGWNTGDQVGGKYGQPGSPYLSPIGRGGAGGGARSGTYGTYGGQGYDGYGGGGATRGPGGYGMASDGGGTNYSPTVTPFAAPNGSGWTNRGGGGAGSNGPLEGGYDGGSGIVIVRWQE
jgi:hypothetical protein